VGNSSVLASDPTSTIRLILGGGTLPSTTTAPSNLGMPGFAWRLSDVEVAQLASFIRNSWGNHAPAVRANQVQAVRTAINRETESVRP
jgi:mono/diheme cytochrome c family protein